MHLGALLCAARNMHLGALLCAARNRHLFSSIAALDTLDSSEKHQIALPLHTSFRPPKGYPEKKILKVLFGHLATFKYTARNMHLGALLCTARNMHLGALPCTA